MEARLSVFIIMEEKEKLSRRAAYARERKVIFQLIKRGSEILREEEGRVLTPRSMR